MAVVVFATVVAAVVAAPSRALGQWNTVRVKVNGGERERERS